MGILWLLNKVVIVYNLLKHSHGSLAYCKTVLTARQLLDFFRDVGSVAHLLIEQARLIITETG